jgi:predicted metal-dependent RNase
MHFRNLTRRREIGANSYLLESGDDRVILDAGMHPKYTGFDAMPDFGPVTPGSADAIMVTHAHHDHIGCLPVVQRRHPGAPVLMTEPTGEVGDAMLHNSVNVMTRQREEKGVNEYPLFTHRELERNRSDWIYRDTDRPFALPNTDLEASLHDAGHIIGSAGVMIRQNGSSLFYTGDVNFESQTVTQAADFPEEGVDVLILETTRGDYERPADYTREREKQRLADLILETYEGGGSVLIPVFALGKTQETLVMLHELREAGLIPDMPVYMGGLSTKITVLYDHYCERIRRHHPGLRILQDIEMLVPPRRRRYEIPHQPRTIYTLSSGMMTEGTISNRFAWKFLDNPRNAIAFVGYTDPETPGARVRTASPGEMIQLAEDLPAAPLRCRVESFDFSAHSTRESLAEYAERLKPSKVILVHGEVTAQDWFMKRFRETLPSTEIILPTLHTPVDLW